MDAGLFPLPMQLKTSRKLLMSQLPFQDTEVFGKLSVALKNDFGELNKGRNLTMRNIQSSNVILIFQKTFYCWELPISCFRMFEMEISAYLNISVIKQQVGINLPLFSTVVPSIICIFLSCRPLVVIKTLSTGLMGVEVTSVSKPGDRSDINTHKTC